jgi:hypothetical protein
MDQSDFMLPRLRHLASKITKLDYKLRRDISVRDLEDGQFSTSGSPGTVLPKIVAGCISCTFLQQETQESEHFRLGISTNERNLIMTLASLQDRTVLRDLICDISQQCFNKLREQVSGVDLGNLMTPSLLSAQLIMQSALHQIPRVRPVLDDIMLHDIGVLVRKIVVELIENEEGSFDGAL